MDINIQFIHKNLEKGLSLLLIPSREIIIGVGLFKK